MANAPCPPTRANDNDRHGPPTGRLAIRGGRINQWPDATARAERREAMRTGPSAFAPTPAIALASASCPPAPNARQRLRKPASYGHAEERADRRRDRERGSEQGVERVRHSTYS